MNTHRSQPYPHDCAEDADDDGLVEWCGTCGRFLRHLPKPDSFITDGDTDA